ncbi:MAG TPA: nickel-binding protein [Kofleriaceae bacterium]
MTSANAWNASDNANNRSFDGSTLALMIYDHGMPRYIVVHHSPGVTPEDFQKSVPAVLEGKYATFVHCYANMVDGLIVNLYDGENEQAVARELERIGFPFDEIKEQQFAASFADLKQMVGG